MNTRIAFNAGEIDENASLRYDVDAVNRGCLVLENWNVNEMGGIERRRGIQNFADAEANSILVPYVYSYAAGEGFRFIINVGSKKVVIYAPDGKKQAEFESGVNAEVFEFNPRAMRAKQVNKLLILTSLTEKPFVVKYDGKSWALESFVFKMPPWKSIGNRDKTIRVYEDSSGKVQVEFPALLEDSEKNITTRDVLRASYWLEQQETRASASELTANVSIVSEVPSTSRYGAKYAVRSEEVITYWVCIKDFQKAETYVAGLDDPGSYPNNFVKAENTLGFESVTPVASVDALPTSNGYVKMGTKIAIRSGYWEYFTCVTSFSKGTRTGKNFSDYPSEFIRGIAVGEALTCKGAWSFFCSGLWYGSYEVRRNYEDTLLSADWEARGISFSQLASASNTQISGTEEQEECYLRLFLTRSRYMDSSTIKAGFPMDSCDNKLIVEGYKHDEILECDKVGSSVVWRNLTSIKADALRDRIINDWSWQAFSARYGYPLLSETYNLRLVFAATSSEPQKLWFSAVDDINNFGVSGSDDASMALTINTTSQNPICWMQSQNNRMLLGTSEAEWILAGGNGGITSSNASIEDHSHQGSDGITSIASSDKVLYVERGGGRVYEFGYSLEADGYRSADLTLFASHIAQDHGGMLRSSLISKPQKVACFVLADGQLAMCTYNDLQQVKAWHRWVCAGKIKDVCALPNGNENDLLFLIVEHPESKKDVIGVVRPAGSFKDLGKYDYESVCITNGLFDPLSRPVAKSTDANVLMRFGEDFEYGEDDCFEISKDGENWIGIDRYEGVLKKGWHHFVSLSRLQYEPTFGVKVKGDRSFSLLAIQA